MKKLRTLQDCIEQIEMSDYECKGGYLKNNTGFIAAKKLAKVKNLFLPDVRVSLPNEMFAMKLHDSILLDFGIVVMRVPGGWLYDCWNTESDSYKQGTFVPLNNEFVL